MRKRNETMHTDPNSLAPEMQPTGLCEIAARDEWQSFLVTSDGQPAGVVVRKIVEPASYMVRYLVVYRLDEQRHVLVPASTVTGGEEGQIHCLLSPQDVQRLPGYSGSQCSRDLEQAVHDAIGHTPYWHE